MKRKYSLLILSALSVGLLAGCGGNKDSSSEVSGFVPGSDISVLNPNGKYYAGEVGTPAGDLPIYSAKGKGDIPYVNVEDYVVVLSGSTELQGLSGKKENGTFVITSSQSPSSKAVIDPAKNEIQLTNYANLVGTIRMNNGYGRDFAQSESTQCIRPSTKTSAVVKGEEDVHLKLADYGMNLYAQGGNIYAPLEFLDVVLNNASLENRVFNGKDYFRGAEVMNNTGLTSYCYSGNGSFTYSWMTAGDTYIVNFAPGTPKEGEKYRFNNINSDGKLGNEYALVLYNDGTGKIFSNTEGKEEESVFNGFVHRLFYELKDEVMTLYVLDLMPNTEGSASKDSYTTIWKINMGKTRYGQDTRSQEVADYNYNLLCLTFDRFYGVKDFKVSGSFDAFFTSKGLKERLRSTQIATYYDAFYEFLGKEIGDGHTSMSRLPIYARPFSAILQQLENKYPSTKVKAITQRQDALNVARFQGLGVGLGHDFQLHHNNTAMVSFDVFAASGFPSYFRNYIGAESSSVVHTETAAFVANAIMEIEEYNKRESTKIKNIIFDISANKGGTMYVMPFLAGIMTKDPLIRVKDTLSGRIVEYHYECDFDGDGVFGDSYADKYNFAVLTSSASFSCGTALPSMLKGTNVKIIGEKSAGGACPVTAFTDATGTPFKTSGSNVIVYKDGDGKYVSVEDGVPVDVEIPEADWYNLEKMDAKMNEIFAK